MPIDFFQNKCKSTSTKVLFGICDDIENNTEIAYIDEENPDNWIGIVSNPSKFEASFYAIDHCVKMLRDDGRQEKSCDGILSYNNKLVFIELKMRKRSPWAREGKNQIIKSFQSFNDNYDISTFDKIEAYVCNQIRPLVNQGRASMLQEFKDRTGINLKIQQRIQI